MFLLSIQAHRECDSQYHERYVRWILRRYIAMYSTIISLAAYDCTCQVGFLAPADGRALSV